MKISFLIYSYFPYGGQQRDFFRIAEQCAQRGNQIDVYTLSWHGEVPENFNVIIVPINAFTNVGRYRKYTSWVTDHLRQTEPSFVVGFNKMPGLDLYFAADPCFLEKADKQRGSYYKLTPRFGHFAKYEKEVFGKNQATQIMILTEQQREGFEKYYPGCASRMHVLPPGIDSDRRLDDTFKEKRFEFRKNFSITDGQFVILQIGSGFKVKGVDRSLKAIASLPLDLRGTIKFVLVGQDNPKQVLKLARNLGILDRLMIVSGSDDVPSFLAGSDLMLHPAYRESAGHVLLEATVSGLPVLTTSTCGYAFHVVKAGSGLVCSEPFLQNDLNQKLGSMIKNIDNANWSGNGLNYGRNCDLYSLHREAANLIDKFARNMS